MISYKVTDQKKFDEKVIDVDLNLRGNGPGRGFQGDVDIEVRIDDSPWGDNRLFTGQHGERDYEDEYGFVIEK